MRRGLLLILAALAPAPAALAQLGPSDPGAPISIQADNGLEWQQNQQLYIARGNALASRGTASVKANTLIAHYREAKAGAAPNPASSVASTGGNSEIYRVEADGNVVITRDTRTIVGDRADYDMDQGIGVVRGKNLKMTTPTDVVTAKDAFEWYDAKQIAVARGDAVATRQNNRTIKADTLTAYMVKVPVQGGAPGQPAKPGTPPAKPAAQSVKGAPAANGSAGNAPPAEESKISRLDAQGHVVVVSGPDIGRGDYAVYNAVTNICTLLGNVTITRGADVITGQYAVMDMNTNVSRIMPASSLPGGTRQRVQGLFVKQDFDHKAGENKSGEKKPGETKPGETKPGETKKGQ